MVMILAPMRTKVISDKEGDSVSTRLSTVVVMKRAPSSVYRRLVASISLISS